MNYRPDHYNEITLSGGALNHGNKINSSLQTHQVLTNLFYVEGLSNAVWLQTGEGTLLVDSCASNLQLGNCLRESGSHDIPLIIYTHGHRDHIFTKEAMDLLDVPQNTLLVAHARVSQRMQISERLSLYSERVRLTQFKEKPLAPIYQSPLVYPSEVYDGETTIKMGGQTFHLIHVQGETDDATMVHAEAMDCIVAGDLLIGSWPNLGNPFKEPRSGYDWIVALKRLQFLKPKIVIPGHGSIMRGLEVENCLNDTIDGLEFVHESVISGMNAGHSLYQMVHEIHLPVQLENSPYLHQTYSRVELAVIAFYRSYAGWWDGDPCSIYPSNRNRVADEVRSILCSLNDEQPLLNRAECLWKSGERTTAMELIQLLIRGREGNPEAQRAELTRDQFLRELLHEDECLMTRAAWMAVPGFESEGR